MGKVRKRCPLCGESSEMTTWLPEKGLDSWLRKFRCKWGHYFYKMLTLKEMQKIGAIEEWVK